MLPRRLCSPAPLSTPRPPQNCVLPELPRFVRCLSLQRSSSARGPVPVWLCDAARVLLVPRATLLSACCDGLQLYRLPPLLVLLTGKRQ